MYKLSRREILAMHEPLGNPYLDSTRRTYDDPVTAAIGVGGSILGGLISGDAAQSAAQTQANAANQSAATQLDMFNRVNAQQAPWRQAGERALTRISELGPQFQHQFNASDLNDNLAPNYKFQLDQGLGAVKNAANTQTGLVLGNALKGINDYAQNFAGNAYQNAFNNFTTNQSNIFNRLSTIAGLGNSANMQSTQAGINLGTGIGNAQQAAGAAQAAGTVGSANAITGGANNALGWYTLPQILNGGYSNPSAAVNPMSYSGLDGWLG